MISRITGALMRAALVAATVVTPSLLLSGSGTGAPEFVIFVTLIAAIFIFSEYTTVFPSILEFRDAPPLNRLRFLALSSTVVCLTLLAKNATDPTQTTLWMSQIGTSIGHSLDFPYSPVRLLVLMMPPDAPMALTDGVRMSAGVAYLISLVAIITFILTIRVKGWPTRNGAFNVWTNMPLFDPTTGGDVVDRLYSDARFNVILGVLLPFIIPAVAKLASELIDPISLSDPVVLIWTVCAWAFLPASMIMRGIALARIAALIEEKRRRAYAVAEAEGIQTA
ncbi:hypothetical protein [Aestuariivita sp.]|uniref:hypothetical protein n=1 Tax=Aestuariivita sp. TaxID=1872407 RepID=UPI003BB1E689